MNSGNRRETLPQSERSCHRISRDYLLADKSGDVVRTCRYSARRDGVSYENLCH